MSCPNDGEVVGVGQPTAVRFDENITDRVAAQGGHHGQEPIRPSRVPSNGGNATAKCGGAQPNTGSPAPSVDVTVNTYGVELG